MNRLLAVTFALLLCLPALPLAAMEAGTADDQPLAGSRASPAVFTNATVAAGLAGVTGDSYAWGDYNNDGNDDLLVKGNRLFRNNGPPNYNFTEVTQTAKIGTSYGYAVWGDYNNDGNLDFFCAGQDERQRDALWRNTGAPGYGFVNASIEAGGMDDNLSPSIAASWVDYDRDSYLDIYVVNWRIGSAPNFEDILWHNNGNGTFTNLTRSAGVVDYGMGGINPPYAGMGVDCADYNNDGWPDIYVGNYLLMPNFLWHNNHNSSFTNFGDIANVSGDPDYFWDGSGPYYGHTAGSCWGDYNNDGQLDLWVGNLAHKDTDRAKICDNPQLMKNLGFPYKFEDFKERAGMPNIPDGSTTPNATGMIWRDDDTFGGSWCDFDNDGRLDLAVPEVKDYYDATVHWSFSHLWHQNGDGTFTDVGNDAGIRVWTAVGSAWADYNNDGQPDQVTEGTYPYGGPREVHLFKNSGTTNHWLKVHLSGTVSNRAAIGARVAVSTGAMTQIREVEGATGGHSHQSSLTQMFGFGAYSGTVSVEIRWPSGIVQNLTEVKLDQTLNVTEGASGPKISALTASSLSPAEGQNITLGAVFSGAPSKFFWDFEGDGQFDLVQNAYQPVQISYPRPGRYYPALKVMDAAGKLGQYESLYVQSSDIKPTSRAGGDRTVNETEPITFDGSKSEGASCDVPNFTYKWSFNDDWKTDWQSSPVLTRVYNQSGPYTATLSVRDDENGISNDTVTVTVLNLPPTVTIGMGELAVEDAPLEFNASGSDTGPDMPFLRYQWSFGDGTDRSPVLVSPRIKHSYAKAGVYTATVTVTDDNGAKGSASINITVANVPPTGMTELSEVRIDEDSQLTLTGTGYDTASDIGSLAFRWDLGDGNITEWMPEPTAVHIYTMSGNYTALFYIRDNDDATASATVNVTVRNLPPTCAVTTGDQDISEDAELSFEGTGKDTPTDRLSLRFRWDFGDGNVSEWMEEAAAVHSYSQKGPYVATLAVLDNDGMQSRAKVEMTVKNLPPIARAKASKSSVDEDSPVSFTSSGSTDTISDLPSLQYLWDFGDGKTAEGPAVNHSYTKQKTFTVVLTVTDNDGAQATAELTVKATNVAPTAKASASLPRVPVGTPLDFSAEAADTASDSGNLRYDWNFGDLLTGTGRNASHTYLAAGFYKVTLKVTDDEGASVDDSVTVEVYKAARPVEPGKGELPLPLIGGVVVAVAVVAVVAALMMMRGKRKAHYEQAEANRAKK